MFQIDTDAMRRHAAQPSILMTLSSQKAVVIINDLNFISA